jgi:hypothetical protein
MAQNLRISPFLLPVGVLFLNHEKNHANGQSDLRMGELTRCSIVPFPSKDIQFAIHVFRTVDDHHVRVDDAVMAIGAGSAGKEVQMTSTLRLTLRPGPFHGITLRYITMA